MIRQDKKRAMSHEPFVAILRARAGDEDDRAVRRRALRNRQGAREHNISAALNGNFFFEVRIRLFRILRTRQFRSFREPFESDRKRFPKLCPFSGHFGTGSVEFPIESPIDALYFENDGALLFAHQRHRHPGETLVDADENARKLTARCNARYFGKQAQLHNRGRLQCALPVPHKADACDTGRGSFKRAPWDESLYQRHRPPPERAGEQRKRKE